MLQRGYAYADDNTRGIHEPPEPPPPPQPNGPPITELNWSALAGFVFTVMGIIITVGAIVAIRERCCKNPERTPLLTSRSTSRFWTSSNAASAPTNNSSSTAMEEESKQANII